MSRLPWTGRRLHIVGVGGAGMSAYARAAAALGASVTGSDRADSPFAAGLRADGVLDAVIGHDPENVPDGDGVEVFRSSAIEPDNVELVAAVGRGLRVGSRAELLGELSRLRRTIGVAGAHGKTTTASMIATALRGCGLDPGYLIGGTLRETGRNGEWGTGEWLVIEADESDRSMLALEVEIAVLTSVELDHHAEFGSLLELEAVYRDFLAGAREAVIWDRPDLLGLRAGPLIAYDAPEPVLVGGRSTFDFHGREVRLGVPGAHNAVNAAAALEVCVLVGADLDRAIAALEGFTGAARRFERVGVTREGAVVYDDYAHHPTELAATLAAARTLDPRRVVAIFQPHLYSRTEQLAREFGGALAGADVVVVVDVYPARERAVDFPGVTGRLVAAAAVDQVGDGVRQSHSHHQVGDGVRQSHSHHQVGDGVRQSHSHHQVGDGVRQSHSHHQVGDGVRQSHSHHQVGDGVRQSHSHHHAPGRAVYWLPDTDDAERILRGVLGDGDLCLVIGAGDIDRLGRRLVSGTGGVEQAGAGRVV